MKSSKKDIIRNIYLYLVTLIGLIMMVIPAVDLIKIGLEAAFFPLASEDEFSYNRIPEPVAVLDKMNQNTTSEELATLQISETERDALTRWQEEFKAWEETEKNKDRAAIRRQRSLVRDISTLLVGTVLFVSHGMIIRRRKDS